MIDVTKLARQNQPPPAYENVDERPASNVSRSSPLTTRPPRPLPMPPINSISHNPSIQSLSPATDAAPAEPYENANPAPQSHSSSSDRLSPVFSTSRIFPSSVGPSQSPATPVGLLHPLDHSSSQDWLDKHSAGISPLSSQSPFNFLSPRVAPEHSQHSISPGSFDHDSSRTANQSFPGTQRGTSAAPVRSRPVSIPGSIQTLSPPPPYSSCEASSSRSASPPSSEYINEMGSTHRPPPPAALISSSHGLPPPAPPTILDPPPARHCSTRSSRAPHEPFLSDAPPPPDSWIAVETTPVEYRLVARLPGFRRDAMCVIWFVTSACSLTDLYRALLPKIEPLLQGAGACCTLWLTHGSQAVVRNVFQSNSYRNITLEQVTLRDVSRLGMTPTCPRFAQSLTARNFV